MLGVEDNNPCDCCARMMSKKEFLKALNCSCKACSPFVVCLPCHMSFVRDDSFGATDQKETCNA